MKIYKRAIHLILASAGLFAAFFGALGMNSHTAYAACDHSLEFSSDKYQVSSTESFTTTLKIKRSGNLNDCPGRIEVAYFVKEGNGNRRIATQYPPATGEITTDTLKINNPSTLTIINGAIELYAAVLPFSMTQPLRIQVSGSRGDPGGSFTIATTAKLVPEKATYNKGENLQVQLSIPIPSQLANQTQVNQVRMEMQIGTKKYSFKKNKSEFLSSVQWFDITVNEASGFVNGTNKITVELFGDDSQLKLSSANVSLTANLGGTSPTPPAGGEGPGTGAGAGAGAGASGGSQIVGKLDSPIAIGNIGELIATILQYLLGLVAALAVLFIIIGGIRMVTSAGNTSSVTAGKQTVTWAIIGLVVSMLAFTIINVVQSLLKVR